jgi:hypothetical protein
MEAVKAEKLGCRATGEIKLYFTVDVHVLALYLCSCTCTLDVHVLVLYLCSCTCTVDVHVLVLYLCSCTCTVDVHVLVLYCENSCDVHIVLFS